MYNRHVGIIYNRQSLKCEIMVYTNGMKFEQSLIKIYEMLQELLRKKYKDVYVYQYSFF